MSTDMSEIEMSTLAFVAISVMVLPVLLIIALKAFGPLPWLVFLWVMAAGPILVMAGAAFISFPQTTLEELETWRTPYALVYLSIALGTHVGTLCRDMPTCERKSPSRGTLCMA